VCERAAAAIDVSQQLSRLHAGTLDVDLDRLQSTSSALDELREPPRDGRRPGDELVHSGGIAHEASSMASRTKATTRRPACRAVAARSRRADACAMAMTAL
jgi:hypothetical protein